MSESPPLKTKWISRTVRLPEGLPERAIALAKTRGIRSLNGLILSLLQRELTDTPQTCAHCPYEPLVSALRAVVKAPESIEPEVRGFMLLDESSPVVPWKSHAAPPASPAPPRRRSARRTRG